jgi:hypothetical protein
MRIKSVLSMSAVFVIAVLLTGDQLRAQDVYRYRLGGNWTEVTDGTTPGWGINPNNNGTPGVGVPGLLDEARVNFAGNTVSVDTEVPAINRLLIGVDEFGVVDINNGGIISTTEDVVVGNNGFDNAGSFEGGTLNVNDGGTVEVGRILWASRQLLGDSPLGLININSGGTVNVASHLWWGVIGSAEINISGTLNQSGGILGLGTSNAVDPSSGTATVNILDGGLLALNNIHAGGTQSSIQAGSKIDIFGSGRVTLPGNFVAVLEGYRDAGLLFGEGVAGAVDITTELVGGGPGDFDSDNDIDGQDFLVWQQNPAVGDLANDWQPNYGAGGTEQTVVTVAAPALSGVRGVPEPGALTLMLVGSIAWCGYRRRCV